MYNLVWTWLSRITLMDNQAISVLQSSFQFNHDFYHTNTSINKET